MYVYLIILGVGAITFEIEKKLSKSKAGDGYRAIIQYIMYTIINFVSVYLCLEPIGRISLVALENGLYEINYGKSAVLFSVIVAIADSLSASRPGARNDTSENYFQRLETLEAIGKSIPGVEKAYAVQAGREIRVMVSPSEVDDLTSYQIAREIKMKIESEMQYPGTIKVTVIRETRATEEAK